MESNKLINPTQCPECASTNIVLDKDYGRLPILLQFAGMAGLSGDLHCQDWVCRACSHDWRVAETYGESLFQITASGEVVKKGGA